VASREGLRENVCKTTRGEYHAEGYESQTGQGEKTEKTEKTEQGEAAGASGKAGGMCMTTYFDMGRGQNTTVLTICLAPGSVNRIEMPRLKQRLVDDWREDWLRDYFPHDPLYAEMDIGGTRIQDIGTYLEEEEEWLKT